MAIITDGKNLNVPLFVDDYGLIDISTADFDPITDYHDWKFEHPLEMNESRRGVYQKKGFLARPNASGDLYAITLRQYQDAMVHKEGETEATVLAAIVPEIFNGVENQWIECRFVKVFSTSASPYPSTATEINVGWLL